MNSVLLSNCISYCTESARNECKCPTILYSWLLYSTVRAHPITLVMLVVCILTRPAGSSNTAQLVKIYGDTSHRNI